MQLNVKFYKILTSYDLIGVDEQEWSTSGFDSIQGLEQEENYLLKYLRPGRVKSFILPDRPINFSLSHHFHFGRVSSIQWVNQ